MRKHISQLCQLCLCLCNGRSWFVRCWSKGQLYLELNAIVVFYRLGYFCRSFSFLEPVFFPNVGIRQPRQNMNIFPSDSHKPKSLPGIKGNRCIPQIGIFFPILSFLELVFFPNVRIRQPRQNMNISHQIPINQNLYLEIYSDESKYKISFLCWTFVIPQILIKHFRWWSKDWNIHRYAPSFFPRVPEEMSRSVDPLK